MKSTLILTIWVLTAASVMAQGTVTFANLASSLIKFGTTPQVVPALQGQPVPTGTAETYSDFRVALYWLNPATSAFEQLGAAVPIAPVAGRFSGGTRTTGAGTPPGTTGTFIVRAWSHGSIYSTYDAVLASGNSLVAVGESATFSNPTGGGGTPPMPPQALFGFTGIILPVPESSTMALALLGGLALLVRRSRDPEAKGVASK